MGNVVSIFENKREASEVLEDAKESAVDVLVIYYDKDGVMQADSSDMDQKSASYIVQQFSNKLLNGGYNAD